MWRPQPGSGELRRNCSLVDRVRSRALFVPKAKPYMTGSSTTCRRSCAGANGWGGSKRCSSLVRRRSAARTWRGWVGQTFLATFNLQSLRDLPELELVEHPA